jgi:hypothetical protein|nr:MAG TPA: Protein of unknown function (DUF1320) [Caudoviricetes sp.]
MFAIIEDLKNNIYQYQTEQITQGDESIILQGLRTAESEVRSYLVFNSQKKYLDGRPHYDTNKIFSARGQERNALILNLVLTVAKWHIIQLSNVDILFETAKERYDRAIAYLEKLSKGEVNLFDLPIIPEKEQEEKGVLPFRMGSRTKFNHE